MNNNLNLNNNNKISISQTKPEEKQLSNQIGIQTNNDNNKDKYPSYENLFKIPTNTSGQQLNNCNTDNLFKNTFTFQNTNLNNDSKNGEINNVNNNIFTKDYSENQKIQKFNDNIDNTNKNGQKDKDNESNNKNNKLFSFFCFIQRAGNKGKNYTNNELENMFNALDQQKKNEFKKKLEDFANNVEKITKEDYEGNNYFDSFPKSKKGKNMNQNSFNEISPIPNKTMNNTNTGIISNNSSFMSELNNLGNSAKSNNLFTHIDYNSCFNKQQNNNNINNDIEKNNNCFNKFNNGLNNEQILNMKQEYDNNIIQKSNNLPQSIQIQKNEISNNISTNNNKSNNIFQNQVAYSFPSQNVSQIKTNLQINCIPCNNKIEENKFLSQLSNNCKVILEEAGESGSEIKSKEKGTIYTTTTINKPFILCPIPTISHLKLITDDEKEEKLVSITFPKNISIEKFPLNSAYCNSNRKLYIFGGMTENLPEASNKVYVIDLYQKEEDKKFVELSPMHYPRNAPSVIAIGDYIYIVGGYKCNKVERYDIKNNNWTELNPMNKNRMRTMLAVYENYLYAFFGMNEDGLYPESIERLDLTNDNSVWEVVLFSNPNNINTKIYASALYQIDELIYFFGGIREGETVEDIFLFNFLEKRLDNSCAKLKWKESFGENMLINLGHKMVQIAENKFIGVYLKIMVE
jgi:hypothetical protein